MTVHMEVHWSSHTHTHTHTDHVVFENSLDNWSEHFNDHHGAWTLTTVLWKEAEPFVAECHLANMNHSLNRLMLYL